MELEKLAELLRDAAHQKEINDNDFEKVIVDAYLKGGQTPLSKWASFLQMQNLIWNFIRTPL